MGQATFHLPGLGLSVQPPVGIFVPCAVCHVGVQFFLLV